MAELSQRKAKEARDRLAKVAKVYNFDDYTNYNVVTQVKDTGFAVNGKLGGSFSVERGLIVWGKTRRNTSGTISVGTLYKLEQELKNEFASIWRENGVEIEFGF